MTESKYRNQHTFRKGHKGYKPWLGKKRSKETKDKLSNALKGRKLSQETRKKMSLARKGKPQPWHRGRKLTKSHKEKIGRKGEDHWNWQGGKSLVNDRHDSSRYKEWRRKVYEKDGYTCQMCSVKKIGENVTLNAHHVVGWMESIELRYEVGNGLTLCVPCHIRMHHGKVSIK